MRHAVAAAGKAGVPCQALVAPPDETWTSEARRRDATMADTVLSAVLALSPGEGKESWWFLGCQQLLLHRVTNKQSGIYQLINWRFRYLDWTSFRNYSMCAQFGHSRMPFEHNTTCTAGCHQYIWSSLETREPSFSVSMTSPLQVVFIVAAC